MCLFVCVVCMCVVFVCVMCCVFGVCVFLSECVRSRACVCECVLDLAVCLIKKTCSK